MEEPFEKLSFGVFKPVGYVVISFPSGPQADQARAAIVGLGVPAADVHRLTDHQMLAQIEDDLRNASPLAAVGQELNLIKAHQTLAQHGYHWLVVKAESDEAAQQIADCAKGFGAERAQEYGRFIITELIEHGSDLTQVSESPDRGLDDQTQSGTESERALLRPPPERG